MDVAVPIRAMLVRKEERMDIGWANLSLFISLHLICQVSKLRPRE